MRPVLSPDEEFLSGRGVEARETSMVVLAIAFLGLSVLPPIASAHDGWLPKEEPVSAPSMTVAKAESTPELHKPHEKPHAPDGESKASDKAKPASNGGATQSAPVSSPYPAEITGKDGAPMVLVSRRKSRERYSDTSPPKDPPY